MSDITDIKTLLAARSINISGSVARDGFDARRFYIFVEVTRNSENRQEPSNKILNEARDELFQLGFDIEYILTDGAHQDIETSVRASLLHSFGSSVRNSFVTVDAKRAIVWLDLKESINSDRIKDIKEKIVIALSLFDIALADVRSTAGDNLPSKTACVAALRGIAPADLPTVVARLRGSGFTVPSQNWLSRVFDNLRKGGFIVRSQSGTYALTLAGLRALGTKKSGKSPDVARLLALAKAGG